MTEQQPYPTGHDPYPRNPEEVDPLAERRRNSAAHHAAIEDAMAAIPAPPSHTLRTEPTEDGYVIRYDDGYDTAIRVDTPRVGRLRIEVASLGDTVSVELPLGAAQVLDSVLRHVAGLDVAAPITGHR